MIKKTVKKIKTKTVANRKFFKIKQHCNFCATPRGQTIIIATVFIAALLILSLSIVNRSTSVSQENRIVNQKISARALAEAGIEKAIFCLNQKDGANCNGTSGANYVGESNIPLNDGTFTTTITTIDSNTKSITSTGFIPNSANPLYTTSIKTQATINADVVTFNYGVQNGIGGLVMTNSTKIIGNIYSNGDITGSNFAEITGDAYVAGGTAVNADQSDSAQKADYTFGKASPTLDIAQSFEVSADNQINKASFYIKKSGAPSDVTVRILADDNGVPSKTVLASGTLTASQVTASYGWVDINFNNPPPVFAGKTYWISVDTSANSTKYWIVGLDNQNGYASGKAMVNANWSASPPTWSDAGGDIDFKIWLGGLTTQISGMKVDGDVHAHTIDNTDVGRDAYGAVIQNNSSIHRDARASSISDSTVSRDAYADSITGTTVGGHRYSGQAQSDPAPTGMPISDGQIQEWKDDAMAEGTTGSISLSGHDEMTLGPKKIIGDVNLSNWAEIDLTGPIWITGDLNLSNFTKMLISPSLGAQGTIVVVDGAISISNSAEINGNGTAGSYLLVISLSSGTAITMANGTATAILYAPYGEVLIPNSVSLKEITAYKLTMNNFATITYETGLANASFSTGPGGSWVLKKGTWQEL